MIDLAQYDAILLGDFGVTTTTPWKDNTPLAMLPGRAEFLAFLQADRQLRGLTPLIYGVCGNKGGVPWRKQTEDQAREELRQTAAWIGTQHYAVCFGCPTCAMGFEKYTTPEMLARRKPSPVMFRELAEQMGVPLARVLIVDHYQDSFQASKALGCGWIAPSSFFAGAAQYIPVTRAEIVRELAQLSTDAGLAEGAMADGEELDLFDIDAVLEAQARAMEE
jgi:hypothetical protein